MAYIVNFFPCRFRWWIWTSAVSKEPESIRVSWLHCHKSSPQQGWGEGRGRRWGRDGNPRSSYEIFLLRKTNVTVGKENTIHWSVTANKIFRKLRWGTRHIDPERKIRYKSLSKQHIPQFINPENDMVVNVWNRQHLYFFTYFDFIVQQRIGWYFTLSTGKFVWCTFPRQCKILSLHSEIAYKEYCAEMTFNILSVLFFSCVHIYFKELLHYPGYYSSITGIEGMNSY